MSDIKRHDHILVSMLEPQAIGYRFDRSRNDWPLHVTLAKWFDVPDIGLLERTVDDITARTAPFKATVGSEEMFGADGDTKVNIIADQKSFQALHKQLCEAVLSQPESSFVNELWMGDEYRAHVTHHANARRHEGDVIAVADMYLVRMADERQCEVVRRFALGVKSREKS